jgi:hypothetical protein
MEESLGGFPSLAGGDFTTQTTQPTTYFVLVPYRTVCATIEKVLYVVYEIHNRHSDRPSEL